MPWRSRAGETLDVAAIGARRRRSRRRSQDLAEASISAWRLVPLPETRTTSRAGVRGALGTGPTIVGEHSAECAAQRHHRDGDQQRRQYRRAGVGHPSRPDRAARNRDQHAEHESGHRAGSRTEPGVPSMSSRSRGSTRHPASIPAASGIRPSTKTQPGKCPGRGSAASDRQSGHLNRAGRPVRSTRGVRAEREPRPDQRRRGPQDERRHREDAANGECDAATEARIEQPPRGRRRARRARPAAEDDRRRGRRARPARRAPLLGPTARTSAFGVGHSSVGRACRSAAPIAAPEPTDDERADSRADDRRVDVTGI